MTVIIQVQITTQRIEQLTEFGVGGRGGGS
jgi:hypothetical protein